MQCKRACFFACLNIHSNFAATQLFNISAVTFHTFIRIISKVMEQDLLTTAFLDLHDKLHHIALSYLRNDEDAKDALQDTWLKLRNKTTVESKDEARNKLIAVLRNVCIDRLRKTKEMPIDAIRRSHIPSSEETEFDFAEHMKEGLTQLQQSIFNLVTHDGMEYKDIASQLSMSIEAVRMNMSRARKRILENYKRMNQ